MTLSSEAFEVMLAEHAARFTPPSLRVSGGYRLQCAAHAEAYHAVVARALGISVVRIQAGDGGIGWTETSGGSPAQRAAMVVAHHVGMKYLASAYIRSGEDFTCQTHDERFLIKLGHGDPFNRAVAVNTALRILRANADEVRHLVERLVDERDIRWPFDDDPDQDPAPSVAPTGRTRSITAAASARRAGAGKPPARRAEIARAPGWEDYASCS